MFVCPPICLSVHSSIASATDASIWSGASAIIFNSASTVRMRPYSTLLQQLSQTIFSHGQQDYITEDRTLHGSKKAAPASQL